MDITDRKIVEVQQGSQEWLALRTQYFTASAAPAMMGASPYQTRGDLLKMMALGAAETVDSATQSRFDAGHSAEAAARPLAEKVIGDDLYPVTCVATVDGLPLLASLDGMTMDETTLFEHKLLNQQIVAAIDSDGEPGPAYYWQMEHQLLVTGATRCLFVTSDGTDDNWRHCWYESKPERRAQLVAGWRLFSEDLKNYQHVEVIPAATAQPISELPALDVRISGSVMASNLATWRDMVQTRIADIKTDLKTDQDFADADATCKFLGEGEKRIEVVKGQVQAQAADIDDVFRAMDEIKAMMRAKRLELEKLVAARKDAIRAEMMDGGRRALAEHMKTLSSLMPEVKADWSGVMKGKKTVASLQNAIDTELARAKIEANQIHEKIILNIGTLDEYGDHATLFPDRRALVLKEPEDLLAAIKARIADHEAEEARKKAAAEAEVQRKAEEQAKQQAAQQQAPSVSPAATEQTQPALTIAGNTQPPADNGARIKLGDISARLGFQLHAEFVASLGIQSVGKERAAILYRESDFVPLCNALIQRIQSAASEHAPGKLARAA